MKSPLVILGATGGIGRGVVRAALKAGWPVVAVARGNRELKALQAAYPGADLTTVAGSVASDAEGAKLARALRKLARPLGGVVAAVCGSNERGRLLDHPAAFLRRKLDEDLLPHLAAARHLLPLLAEGDRGGSYVLIGGPGSEHPWAGYGHRSIGAAALRMLARVLHDEARQMSVRVQLLAVDVPVRTEFNDCHACPEWPTALSIGQRAVALIEQAELRSEPPRAIVTYARAPGPLSLPPYAADLSDDIDREPARPAPSARAQPQPATQTPAPATVAPEPVPDPNAASAGSNSDSPADPKTQRCLQDARALLHAITATKTNQEPSPQ
ncbi:SDR family NAD(P)-dependent oxidoreductase [Lysobacter silvisoli]|uniref:SDR family NAD(P)-dependent oxidoreductase n=1 Tax=Lysobacter silvisoli TaxID=2293254 RepID=A0A371JYI9_9GAMM|nr:SDR family oxidoreductase [Lysobacter silvisoli]RDZ26637.1 SDR family NAD(P)-dependent oxidoreductase [Lysobacter silvisoli]